MQGCVKVWDIRETNMKSPVSQLDCLVSSLLDARYLKDILSKCMTVVVTKLNSKPTYRKLQISTCFKFSFFCNYILYAVKALKGLMRRELNESCGIISVCINSNLFVQFDSKGKTTSVLSSCFKMAERLLLAEKLV